MHKRIHAWITGRVQGVSYRAYTQKQARRLGLTGWVRNLSDGRVELVAEGPAAEVDALLAWCRKGPMFARVDHVEVREIPPSGEFEAFDVRRDVG